MKLSSVYPVGVGFTDLHDEQGKLVASVYLREYAPVLEAAPDMLEVLRLTVERASDAAIMLQDYHPALANWLIDVEEKARAAIAKAEPNREEA